MLFLLQNSNLFCIYLVGERWLRLSYSSILHRLCISPSGCAVPNHKIPTCFVSILLPNAGFASHTVQSCIVFVSHHLVVPFQTTKSPSVLYLSCFQTQALPLIQFNPASSLYLTIWLCCSKPHYPHLFCIYPVAKRRLCLSYSSILHRLCISPSCFAVSATKSPSILYPSCCRTLALLLMLLNIAPSLYLTILLCCSNYKIPTCFVSVLLPNAGFASHTVKSCTIFVSHHLVVLFLLQNPHLFCIYLVAKRRLCLSYC